jgi:hypothetical protein
MIARKPQKEAQAAKFIAAGAGNGRAARRNFVRIITNFDPELLDRLDAAAAALKLNRSAFIVSAVTERLRQVDETGNDLLEDAAHLGGLAYSAKSAHAKKLYKRILARLDPQLALLRDLVRKP